MSRLARCVIPVLTLVLFVSAVFAATALARVTDRTRDQVVAPRAFLVSDDPLTGKIVAENELIKVVWGYKPLSSEFNNRSGGSIYGLYDKLTDPHASLNLVQIYDFGTGGSSPSRAGIGGLGSTKAYIRYSSKAITEIGTKGKLLAKSIDQLGDGSVVVRFTFAVRDWDGVPQYQLTKRWTITTAGTITLDTSWLWMVSTMVNDPNYNFAVSRDYGWTRLGWFGHHWAPTTCGGPDSNGSINPNNRWVYDNILATEDDDDYGTYHVQSYRFDGAATGTVLTVAMNPAGGGFDSTGLFKFGYNTWKPVDGTNAIREITGEFSNYRTLAYGHQLRWGSWFSCDGADYRFRPISAGTTWSDSMRISIGH